MKRKSNKKHRKLNKIIKLRIDIRKEMRMS